MTVTNYSFGQVCRCRLTLTQPVRTHFYTPSQWSHDLAQTLITSRSTDLKKKKNSSIRAHQLWAACADPHTPRTWCSQNLGGLRRPKRTKYVRAKRCGRLAPTHMRHIRGVAGTWAACADPNAWLDACEHICGRLAPTHRHHARGVAKLGRLAPTRTHAPTRGGISVGGLRRPAGATRAAWQDSGGARRPGLTTICAGKFVGGLRRPTDTTYVAWQNPGGSRRPERIRQRGGPISGRLTPTRWRHTRGIAGLGRLSPTRSRRNMCEQDSVGGLRRPTCTTYGV